ncbi:MAG: CBS domain-containing protein [Bdellovibrionales bacterium]|nr:CBS domain-containing protein [Bdellovibrionales bacterium]
MSLTWYKFGTHLGEYRVDEVSSAERSKNPYAQVAAAVGEKRTPATTLRQIMTSPVLSMRRGTTMHDAFAFIRQHRLRHVPVMHDNKLVGVVSERDLLREASRQNENFLDWVSGAESRGRRLEEFMTTKLLTGLPSTLIRDAARAMITERIGCLPVLDEKQRLVGILTRTDVLRAIVAQAPLELWI